MKTKPIVSVTIVHADGETETFENIDGFHRTDQVYEKGAKSPDEAHTRHSIHWND